MGVRRSDCGGASTATVSDTAHHTAKGDIMATIHDVAIATGVSDATVSRALRGMNSVRPSTRQLVLDAARRLDFTLSRSASSFKRAASKAHSKRWNPTATILCPYGSATWSNCMDSSPTCPATDAIWMGSSSRHSRWTTANRRCFPACISPRSPSTHGALPACPHP